MSGTYFEERPSCPACRSTRYQTVFACDYLENPVRDFLVEYYRKSGRLDLRYLEGARYVLDECTDCGLIFQRYFPGDEFSEVLYREKPIPLPVAERGHPLNYYERHAETLLSLIAYFNRRPHMIRVFDFGFGWAEWISMAKGFGLDASGSELTEVKKVHARARGINVIEWNEIPGSEFDYIQAAWVFEHLPHPQETIEHLAQGLAKGGLLMISVPYRHDVKRRLATKDCWKAPRGSRNDLIAVQPLEHLNSWEGDSLNKMAAQYGLTPVTIPLSRHRVVMNWGDAPQTAKSLLRPFDRVWNAQRREERYFLRSK